jgi:hypothetical protein
MLRLLNQYPAPPVYAPKLEVAHTKSSPLSDTTMISMVRLAMIVEMAFRDLRLFFALDLARFSEFILFPYSNASSFTDTDRFSKTGKFKPGIMIHQHVLT